MKVKLEEGHEIFEEEWTCMEMFLFFLLDLVVAGIVGALVVIISLWTGWSLSVVIVPGLGIIKMFYNF